MIGAKARMVPPRAVLEHGEGAIWLPLGVVYLGRGEGCLLRIDDQGVSRQHLALEVSDRVMARDLGSRNGTLLNGQALCGAQELADGDLLTLGRRSVRVRITPGDPEDTAHETPPMRSGTLAGIGAVSLEEQCPACQTEGTFADDRCSRCGHELARVSATNPTDPYNAAVDAGLCQTERRAFCRQEVEVAAHYRSATLQIAARATELSRGGAFLLTDRFDGAGAECEVELFARKLPSITFRGRVSRVVRRGVRGRNGMAVQFEPIEDEQIRWLARLMLEGGGPGAQDADAADR